MEPRIQYAKTSDGVSIAYATAGEGKCLIVVPSPPVSHVQRQWELYSELYGGLAQRFRAVWFDCRGSGLSDRSPIDFSTPAILRDFEAVADRAGGTQFSLCAMYDGVPFAISYASTRPEKVSHLILADSWTKFSDQDRKAVLEIEASLRHQDWTLYTETFARVLMGYEDPVFAATFGEFIRDCVEPEALRAAYSHQESWAWDVPPDLLDRIKMPTLVLHNRGNRFLSMQAGQRLAASIADARFRLIDDMEYAEVPRLIEDSSRRQVSTRRLRPSSPQGCWPSSSPTSPTPPPSLSASATLPFARRRATSTAHCAPLYETTLAPRSRASCWATGSSPSSPPPARRSRPHSPADALATTPASPSTSACTPGTSSART